jgi:hypothetical protein
MVKGKFLIKNVIIAEEKDIYRKPKKRQLIYLAVLEMVMF